MSLSGVDGKSLEISSTLIKGIAGVCNVLPVNGNIPAVKGIGSEASAPVILLVKVLLILKDSLTFAVLSKSDNHQP